MYASHICKGLYKWIQEKEQYGEIHSVFKNTINILSEDGRFIPVISMDKPMSPNSIKLEDKIDFNDLNLKAGEKGIFTKDSFISEKLSISYEKAILWDKEIRLPSQRDLYKNFQLKLKIVKEFIYNEGNKDGIFNLMNYIPGGVFPYDNIKLENKSELFIKDRFIKFIYSFIEYDVNNINLYFKKIIGYGAGLTPSMDDFISGMMIANIYVSYFLGLDLESAYSLNYAIVKDIDNKTTLVSEEMLRVSSLGEANEDIRELMIALTGERPKEELKQILARVISFGHSSGTDILCGIYIASSILMEKYKDVGDI